MSSTPRVLFVCSRNGGKSQMAAGLAAQLAGGRLEIHSAGTKPADQINALSAESLAELGIDISNEVPTAITDEAIQAADIVITLGSEAKVHEIDGTEFRTWVIDEPSTRGIEGMERMRLVRDDIRRHIEDLLGELTGSAS